MSSDCALMGFPCSGSPLYRLLSCAWISFSAGYSSL